MTQGVHGTVEAGRLAVPEAENACVFRAGKQADLLRAPEGGGRQVLVDARLEDHAMFVEERPLPPKLLVETAERRSAVAGDEAGGVATGVGVEAPLV